MISKIEAAKTNAALALAKQRDKIAKLQGKRLPSLPKAPKSMYSEILAEHICSRIANGESLKKICRDDGFPDTSTVMKWVNSPDEEARPGFQAQFLNARELGYHLMADEIIEISDNSSGDKKKRWVNGKEIDYIDHENIQRDALRVSSRKFILSKALPKIYGDSIKVEHSVSVDFLGRLDQARKRVSMLENEGKLIEAVQESVMITNEE